MIDISKWRSWRQLFRKSSIEVTTVTQGRKLMINYFIFLYSKKTYLCYDLKAKFLIDNTFQAVVSNDSMLFETFEIISKEVESNIIVDTFQMRLRRLLFEFWLVKEH